jgi:hypothetical protein
MSKLNVNPNGFLTTLLGISISLSAGILAFNQFPRTNTAVCNFLSPIANFEDELQWAKSINANNDCKSKTDNLQLMLTSILFFAVYLQILRSLILASYLYQKHQDNKDNKFYLIEDAEQMYSGLLSNLDVPKPDPKFDTLEALKANHLAQTFAINAFINSMPLRERGEVDTKVSTHIQQKKEDV